MGSGKAGKSQEEQASRGSRPCPGEKRGVGFGPVTDLIKPETVQSGIVALPPTCINLTIYKLAYSYASLFSKRRVLATSLPNSVAHARSAGEPGSLTRARQSLTRVSA